MCVNNKPGVSVPGTDTELIGVQSVVSHREKQEFQLAMRNALRTTVGRISLRLLAEVHFDLNWQHLIASEI
jgi:hypothetical protein